MTTAEDFFASGPPSYVDGVERDRHGRYLLPEADGEQTGWTRATTLAGATDERFHLEQWERRLVALGMARRPDLVALAATAAGADDKAVLADVIRQARDAAGGDAGAQMGTAWHLAVMRALDGLADGDPADAVWERIPDMFRDDVTAVLACLAQHHLRPVAGMVERVVRVDAFHAAGQFDVVCEFTEGPHQGERVTVDLKTQKDPTGLGSHSIAVQLALYNHADALWNSTTRRYEPMPERLRTDFALVLHLRPGSGQCLAYRVDTAMGWWAARLSAEVREWRRRGHLVTPFVPSYEPWQAVATTAPGSVFVAPTQPSTPEPAVIHVAQSGSIRPSDEPGRVIYTDPSGVEWVAPSAEAFFELDQSDDGDGEYPEVGGAGVPSGPVTAPDQPLVADTSVASSDEPAGVETLTPEAQAAALAKRPKAELQEMCRKRGITDLQRVRTKLAAYIVAKDRGLSEVGGVALPGGVVPAPTAEPPHPLTATRLARVATAATMGDLGVLHTDVARAVAADPTDPGWVPALDLAAKARAGEIDAAGGNIDSSTPPAVTTSSTDPAVVDQVERGNAAAAAVVAAEQAARSAALAGNGQPESDRTIALRMIEQATTQGDLARVYEQWTQVHGMGAWDNELSDAGVRAQRRIAAG